MALTYLAMDSPGGPFETGETRTVIVTQEVLGVSSGYEGDTVEYVAVVKDNTGAALPPVFHAELMINGTELLDIVFGRPYDPMLCLLMVFFVIPAPVGEFIVKLTSEEQII